MILCSVHVLNTFLKTHAMLFCSTPMNENSQVYEPKVPETSDIATQLDLAGSTK